MSVTVEPVTGHYMRLPIHGRQHRLYWEEAGNGTPAPVSPHCRRGRTAVPGDPQRPGGASRFRVVVFDMPWHGKSSPPEGWEREEYKLTTDGYVELVATVAQALGLDRPAVMGCSIGGRVVLELARRHAGLFRAVIGLQSSAFVQRYFDLSYLHKPNIHGGEVCAACCYGLVGPGAPAKHRWETLWHYMQVGPGVFLGDLHFYLIEGDVSDRLAEIDTARCPVFLLTGEYDYSCTPEASRETAAKIPGADLTVMQGLGHFPMSEDPERFRGYLLPVLERIAGIG